MSQCKIYLENYTGTYYPGNEIRGRLECYFNNDTNIRGVKIRLRCVEHNEWNGTEEYTDTADNKVKTRSITLTGKHDILYVEQTLFGSGSGTHAVSRGRHVYPFVYLLPDNIPSTFTGPHGSISFVLKGIVDIPMGFDHEDNFIFIVVSPIDFNKMPKQLQDPSNYSDEKTVCCWCCKGGNVTVDVELPKRAYIAGEVINLKVTVSNLSNSNVEDLKVKFTKTVTYKVTSPNSESKNDLEEIANLKEHGVGAHGEHTYNLSLQIPQHIVVPNFAQCNLFKVTYLLQVSCEMPSCTIDLDVPIWDIQLGHIQWRNNYTPEGGTMTSGFLNNLPPIDGAYPAPFSSNVYPPPPPGVPGPTPYPPTGYNMGFTVPSDNPSAPLIYPGGPPTAPASFGASAPPKAQEAAMGGGGSVPPGLPGRDLPPPSYNELQQTSSNFYPPR